MRLISRVIIVLALAAAASSAQQSDSSENRARWSGEFSISGVVINALGGDALPRTRVMLSTAGGTQRSLESMVTGEDGRFQFTKLAAGKYSLSAQRKGFPTQALDQHEGYSTAVAVGPDKQSDDLIFRLKPSATLSGTVIDEYGDAVRNGQVMLFFKGVQNGQQGTHLRSRINLDDRGSYRFGDLPAGTYFVAVSARPWFAENNPRFLPSSMGKPSGDGGIVPNPGYNAALDVAYPITYFPGANDPSGARPIVLQSGARETADITLAAVPSLHLQITNMAGDASQNVHATLTQRAMGGMDSQIQANTVRRTADTLEISGVAPGHYEINLMTFSPKGGRPQSTHLQSVDLSSDTEVDGAKAPAATTVTGVVTFEGGKPPQQARIEFTGRDSNFVAGGPVSATGEFENQQLAPGWYDVRVPNIGPYSIKSLTAAGAQVAGLRVKIVGPAQLAVTMSSALGVINGVVKAEGKTGAGAMVVLVPEDPTNHGQWFRRDQSDSDGTFTLSQVLPGKYIVVAIENGWNLEWANPTILQPYLANGEVLQVGSSQRLKVTVKLQ